MTDYGSYRRGYLEGRRSGEAFGREAENAAGGEAREVVAQVAGLVGVDLVRDPHEGGTWSPENMARVAEAVREMTEPRIFMTIEAPGAMAPDLLVARIVERGVFQ